MSVATPIAFAPIEQRPCSHAGSMPTDSCQDCQRAARPVGPIQKNYDLPPRPKPGRKPATDTPPNKRKAQNRMAQRNFRERRAQKVNELEGEMDSLRLKHREELESKDSELERKESELRMVTSELSRCRLQLDAVRVEFEQLRIELANECRAREDVQSHNKKLDIMLRQHVGAVALPPRPARPAGFAMSTQVTLGDDEADTRVSESACKSDCGPSDCACIDAIMSNDQGTEENGSDTPTPTALSPSSTDSTETNQSTHDAEMEIDMTTFNSKPSRFGPISPLAGDAGMLENSGPMIEDCGFCTGSTTCPCREIREAQEEQPDVLADKQGLFLATERVKPAPPSGCSGDPGSCQQCMEDPGSKDFCISFSRQARPSIQAGRPGRTPAECGRVDCCKTRQPTGDVHPAPACLEPNAEGRSLRPAMGGNAGGSSMDCAAVYNRLRTHPHFQEAMAEKESWMPGLRAAAVPVQSRQNSISLPSPSALGPPTPIEGRSAFEIDAASVIATFRHFDTRFGTDSRNDWKKDD